MKKIFAVTFFAMQCYVLAAQSLATMADSVRRYRGIPGLVYAVFTTDTIFEKVALGNKKMRTRTPVQLQNRFQIGTNTTGFTAYIAARMVQDKKITWNTTVGQIFPELNGQVMKVYLSVTLKQLLGQRAGVVPFTEINDNREIHSLPGTPAQQRQAFVAILLKKRPIERRDTSAATYSVAGSAIAGWMLEKAGKKSWEQLVDQYVNKPLNIHVDFGFPTKTDSTQPVGHWDLYGTLTAEGDNYWGQSFIPVAAASNINLSIDDYVAFIRDHLKGLQNQKSVIGAAAEQLLFGSTGYSMGWANTQWNGKQVAYWLGRGGIYSSYVEVIREKNMGIVILCNSGAADGRAGILNLGRMLREHYAQ